MINGHVAHGVERHVGRRRFGWVLDNGEAAPGFHCVEPGRAVVELTSEDDADDPFSMGPGGAAKKRIDRGPGSVLARTGIELHDAIVNQEMAIGRRDVNAVSLVRHVVLGADGSDSSSPAQDFRQDAAGAGVHHDEDRARIVFR